jgi:hypothetical protein
MSDKISLGFTGSDTGIARLVADLEGAGATKVTAEPQAAEDEHPEARRYEGQIAGLEPDKAISTVAAYLATAAGHRAELNGIEVPLPV